MIRKLNLFGSFLLPLIEISRCESIGFGVNLEGESTLADCIVEIIENAPGTVRKISILTSDSDSTLVSKILRRVQVPAVINCFQDRRGPDERVYSDFIIVKEENLDVPFVLSNVLWNGNTKFLIICDSKEMEANFQIFWKLNVVNVFALTKNVREIRLYSYLPFQTSECNSTKPVLIDKWTGGASPNGGLFKIYEKTRIKNLNRCQVNVSVVDVKPVVFVPKDRSCLGSEEIDGLEVHYLKAVAEKLNFTAIYCTPRDKQNWGRIFPAQGVVGEVYKGMSEFGFGLIAPILERYENLDLTRNYNGKECITFAVPSGAGREPLFWLKNIMSDLRLVEWILILTSLVIVIVIYWLASEFTLSTAFVFTFGVLIGHSVKIPKRTPLKYLTLAWILFASAITEIYQASLGSQITVPLKPPEIKTLADLADSDLEPLGYRNMFEIVKRSVTLTGLKEIKNRFVISNVSFQEALTRMVNERDSAYIRHMSTFTYEILVNARAKGNIRPLTNCVYDYFPSIALRKNSPFTRRVNDIVGRLFESGISLYWKSLFLQEVSQSNTQFVPLKLRRSLGIVAVLCTGLVISSVVFLAEIAFGLRKREVVSRKRKPGNRYS